MVKKSTNDEQYFSWRILVKVVYFHFRLLEIPRCEEDGTRFWKLPGEVWSSVSPDGSAPRK